MAYVTNRLQKDERGQRHLLGDCKIPCNHDRKYLGQSSGQGKMAAYLLIHVRGILKCLHVDSQQHQHFRASETIIPRSRNYYNNVAGTQ